MPTNEEMSFYRQFTAALVGAGVIGTAVAAAATGMFVIIPVGVALSVSMAVFVGAVANVVATGDPLTFPEE